MGKPELLPMQQVRPGPARDGAFVDEGSPSMFVLGTGRPPGIEQQAVALERLLLLPQFLVGRKGAQRAEIIEVIQPKRAGKHTARVQLLGWPRSTR